MYFTTFWRQWKKEWDAPALCHNPHHYYMPHEYHVIERDINRTKESSPSSFHSQAFYFHSLCPFCSSQSTSTGNGVTKQGASSWGAPFSLRPLQLPLIFQRAGKYAIAGLCFSVDTGGLITVVLSAGFDKREEQNNLSSRSKNIPGLVQTQKLLNKGQTLNRVQNCGLWKMWCGGWEECLCNPW